jgi:flagellar basal body-associated protein FliL
METRNTASSESNIWIWIMLAILLVVSGVVAVGSLKVLDLNQQAQTATGSQTTPSPR